MMYIALCWIYISQPRGYLAYLISFSLHIYVEHIYTNTRELMKLTCLISHVSFPC
ncbi:uncharacterized protein DS421_3g87570 [Arachis hypogaea]|nr:uncharacterized protein DS421_3g87570 [Arachis hypogaea]